MDCDLPQSGGYPPILRYPTQPHSGTKPIRKDLLYVQEVVTLQKKYLIYMLQKMRFTPFINYYDTNRVNIIRLQSKIILGHIMVMGHMNSIG